jgi:predicted esterase
MIRALFRAMLAMLAALPAAPALATDPAGHLTATPASFSARKQAARLDLPGGARAYIPPGAGRNGPAPMLLLLHGTGGSGAAMIDLFRGHAAREGIILLALTARGENWDSVDLFFDDYEAGRRSPAGQWAKPEFGQDLDRIDAALAALFARVAVDPGRVGVAGFSHGASYALMLGTANPQLFGTIVALSPGILVIGDPPGGQNVYVSHGKGDTAQPYWRTEKVFVPRLGQLGYRVTFQPFAGGHGIPREVQARAVRFFLDAPPPPRTRSR